MSKAIEGKVVVITGASSGLGEAAARALAARGAKLVLGARRLDRLEALAAELGGSEVLVQATDVTDAAQVQALADAALARFGRIDVMLNNAGLMPHSPLERLKIADWDRMIDVNIKGVLYGIAAVLPAMQAQRSGHIVNVASVAGLKVRAGATVYAATKHAVRALSEGLRLEVKPYNIRTTVISPGALDTELIEHITEPDVLEGVRKTYANAVPADTFARALIYALEQPPEVDVNEIVLRPTIQEF
ncbi:SDR family oxidoreductase [Pelomonas sp. KK5]|uniref:SDR family oxidoreductase n=1 Tax=Pelomonas sp. KK5 TaxID=1855730 RepID=UPI00097C8E3D|nr:SDR family oxidoreductase [Pelomonas sp. KK5]